MSVRTTMRPYTKRLASMASDLDECVYFNQDLSEKELNQLSRAKKAISDCRDKLIRIGHEQTLAECMLDDFDQSERQIA